MRTQNETVNIVEGQNQERIEHIKHHLTCAAETSEEVGLFLQTAKIKQVSSDICRMQGKMEDSDKLECSVSKLMRMAKTADTK